MEPTLRHDRGLRRVRRATISLVAAVTLVFSCQTLEDLLPTAVVVAGGIASAAALYNFQGDPGYGLAVTGLIGTLTPLGVAAADSFVENRRRQRELKELERMEAEIEAEYAQLEAGGQPGANTWAGAAPTPAPTQAPPPGSTQWQSAAPVPVYPGQGAQPAGQQPAQTQPAQTQLAPQPGAQAGQPSGSPWGDQYAGGQVFSRGAPLLALDVALLKRVEKGGKEISVPISNQEVLYDGIDDEVGADKFRIFLRPSQNAYVYVIAIDALGRVQPLYPRLYPDKSNPVPANTGLLLPGRSDWYGLDEYTGIQHVYVHARATPHPELEKQLQEFVSKPPPLPDNKEIRYVSEPTLLGSPTVQGRGLTGVKPATSIKLPTDEGEEIEAERTLEPEPGAGVLVTRIFEHH